MHYIIKYNDIELKKYNHWLQAWCYLLMNGYIWKARRCDFWIKDSRITIEEVIDD